MKSSALQSKGLYPQAKKPAPSLRNLALGILLQAFRDIVAPKKTTNKDWDLWRQDAFAWFRSDESHAGSFRWVCELLQMSAPDLREWLGTYKSSDEAGQKEMARKLVRFQIRH